MQNSSIGHLSNMAAFLQKMMYLQRQEQTSVYAAQTQPLAKHDHSDINRNDGVPEESIEVGSIYEIDHSNLPLRTPVQLRSIRVVIVNEMTELNVSVGFPSIESLRLYFINKATEIYPEWDENFVMGMKLAEKILFRRVTGQEFLAKKNIEEFWMVNSISNSGESEDVVSNKGICLSELKGNGMLSWGSRRQVRFLGKHTDKPKPQSSSSYIKEGREDSKCERKEEEVDGDDDDNDNNNENEDDEEEEDEKGQEDADVDENENDEADYECNSAKSLKRKQYSFRNLRKPKKVKHEKPSRRAKAKNNCKPLVVLKDAKDRWSSERYKLAEKNLLEVMKAKGAVIGNPILRPELRAEARKRIGDTGLLDHLLKHMAGKIAPGGTERFRRRHNAEGAMEYWLESADLVSIRRQAGVQDPYWTPPPGWKPGDCPTQDPVCAKELKFLKEETLKLRSSMEEMVTKKHMEEQLAKVRRELEEFVSKKKQEESHATVVSSPHEVPLCLDRLETSLAPWKSDLDSGLVQLEKYKEQLMVVSGYLKGMEEAINNLTSKVEERTRSEVALMVSGESPAEKEKKQADEGDRALILQKEVGVKGGSSGNKGKGQTAETKGAAEPGEKRAAEDKAEKIERLKSGFRICRPQGTFLWPNMVGNSSCNKINNSDSNTILSPQVVVQVEDLLMIPTPPSVSSSTSSAPPQLLCNYHQQSPNPPSPVKPLAERRPVKVNLPTVSRGEKEEDNYYTITTNGSKTPTFINLNDFPSSQGEEIRAVLSSKQKLLPSMTRREMVNPWEVVGSCSRSKGLGTESRDVGTNSQQRQTKCLSSSSCSSGTEMWLALATPNAILDDSSCGLTYLKIT